VPVQSATAARLGEAPLTQVDANGTIVSLFGHGGGKWKRRMVCGQGVAGWGRLVENPVKKGIAGDGTQLSTQRGEMQAEEDKWTEARNFGEEIGQERKIPKAKASVGLWWLAGSEWRCGAGGAVALILILLGFDLGLGLGLGLDREFDNR
jgi:hypothetical protein